MVPRIFVSFCAGKNCLMGVQNCHVCSVSSVSVTRAKAMCHYACGDSCEKDYIRHLSTKIDVHPSMHVSIFNSTSKRLCTSYSFITS